jgi:hypothetical protein
VLAADVPLYVGTQPGGTLVRRADPDGCLATVVFRECRSPDNRPGQHGGIGCHPAEKIYDGGARHPGRGRLWFFLLPVQIMKKRREATEC